MKKTVFTRYSNERSPYFAIKTVITKDENGALGVEKYPNDDKAVPHIESMLQNQTKIDRFYGSANFKAAPCYKIDGGISFSFIEGETFEQQLEDVQHDIKLFFEKIDDMYKRLVSLCDCEFERTSEFDNVFGNTPLPQNLHTIKDFTCFDLAFGNIIVDKSNVFNIIDYEWCFNFAIPMEYVFYRALNLYVILNGRHELLQKDIFGYLGFDKKAIEAFDSCERAFQQYVRQGCFSIRDLYEKFNVKNYALGEILQLGNEQANAKGQCFSQIYIDYGNGFSEDGSIRKPVTAGQATVVDIVLTNKVRACRFDPEDNSCVMQINRIRAFCRDGMYQPRYTTNGCISNDIIFFGCNDPQILFEDLAEETSLIQIEYTLINTTGQLADSLAMAVFDKAELAKRLDEAENKHNAELEKNRQSIEQLNCTILNSENLNIELNRQLTSLNVQLEQLTAELDYKTQYIAQIENSRAWKLILKLRSLMGK